MAINFKYNIFSKADNVECIKDSLGVKNSTCIRILCIGDVVGSESINICSQVIPGLKTSIDLDVVLANGENSAPDGRGITLESFNALKNAGVDVITTGNHVWRHSKIYPLLNSESALVRPLNFPESCPGKGLSIIKFGDTKVAFVNLLGRVFIRENTSCPFLALEKALLEIPEDCKVIVVDMHAEASSEKVALALNFDGRVSAVFGTHTHVQTADARIMPGGTGFMTDLGSVCSLNSCIGMAKEDVISGFLTQMPARFKVHDSLPIVFSGAVFQINTQNGKCEAVLPIRIECI